MHLYKALELLPTRGLTFCPKQMSTYLSIKQQKRIKYNKIKRSPKKVVAGGVDDPENLNVYEYGSASPMKRVYTWGMACYGALGVLQYVEPRKHQKKLRTMHRPVRCSVAERAVVSDVSCGYGYTLFLLKSEKKANGYQLMGTGVNTEGQIGHHEVKPEQLLDILITPIGISIPDHDRDKDGKLVHVSAGRSHSVVCSANGAVFTMGNNAHGQCARPIIEEELYAAHKAPVRVPSQPWMKELANVHCGQDHTLFVTETGHVYSCGWGADGQTGLSHFDSVWKPTRVCGDVESERIVKVATSTDCVLALNDRGEVFGWGNSEYGQFHAVTEEQQLSRPTQLPLPGLGKIIDIACGGTICIVLNENHDVFVWGFGILGKGPKVEHSYVPLHLPNPLFGRNDISSARKVVSVHAGVNANACINDVGELYTWGKNKGNCLGLGHDKDQYFPLKVVLTNPVYQVSLGVDHSAALCKPLSKNR